MTVASSVSAMTCIGAPHLARNSFTPIDSSGRIFYSGTHEAYDFGELDPGKARTRATEAAEKESGLAAQLREAEEDIGRFATLERSVTALNSRASSRLRVGFEPNVSSYKEAL